jgi:vacuolar-type H+-ATPase subunit F/Vma7
VNVVAIGADGDLAGLALAGVQVVSARTPDQVLAAWRALGDEVGLVVLSPDAADVLDDVLHERPVTLTVVIP